MSEEQKAAAQAWVSIWIDEAGGLSFEADSSSTTQLLGMVRLTEQMIIERALNRNANGETTAES
jgi:hypothetical protein